MYLFGMSEESKEFQLRVMSTFTSLPIIHPGWGWVAGGEGVQSGVFLPSSSPFSPSPFPSSSSSFPLSPPFLPHIRPASQSWLLPLVILPCLCISAVTEQPWWELYLLGKSHVLIRSHVCVYHLSCKTCYLINTNYYSTLQQLAWSFWFQNTAKSSDIFLSFCYIRMWMKKYYRKRNLGLWEIQVWKRDSSLKELLLGKRTKTPELGKQKTAEQQKKIFFKGLEINLVQLTWK